MISHLFHQAMRVSLAVAVCLPLTANFGAQVAAPVWAAVMLVACTVGAVLLRTSEVGRVTWKNRIAGFLIPWGVRVSGGKLWPIPLVSWVVWMTIGGGVFTLTPGPGVEGLSSGDVRSRVLLGLSWAVAGSVFGYTLVNLSRNFSINSSSGRTLTTLSAVVAGLIVLSVTLHLFGFTLFALVVTGGPILLIGGGYGLFVLAVLVFGRNSRWN